MPWLAAQAFVCLALTSVANIGGREMAETLAADIQRLLVSQYVGARRLRMKSIAHLFAASGIRTAL